MVEKLLLRIPFSKELLVVLFKFTKNTNSFFGSVWKKNSL